MRILILSRTYAPAMGGVEEAGVALVDGISRAGHTVSVVTSTPAIALTGQDDNIVRQPTTLKLIRMIRSSNLIIHNGPSVPWVLLTKLLNVSAIGLHHTYIGHAAQGLRARLVPLRRRLLLLAKPVAVSKTLALGISDDCAVVYNCLPSENRKDSQHFLDRPAGELLFAGRLVSDKGLELLIQATGTLRSQGTEARLTIYGEGPEVKAIDEAPEGVKGSIKYRGRVDRQELLGFFGSARVAVFPSLWVEPFGLVALEAASSGCWVIVPMDTGLVEAAGPAAITFNRGSLPSLIEALRDALSRTAGPSMPELERHLEKFKISRMVEDLIAQAPRE